jgi:hypothetical protein
MEYNTDKEAADNSVCEDDKETAIAPRKEPVFAGASLDELNKETTNTLMSALGIRYTNVADGRVEATMPVDGRTRQHFGILSGGATVALAETLAGVGSMMICGAGQRAAGQQVSANHISSAYEGDTVHAIATLMHRGRTSHVWNIDVFTSTDKLVSTVRVVNAILSI